MKSSALFEKVAFAILLIGFFLGGGPFLRAQTRVKDVATIQGARDNQLIGYGLVVGLDGKGDSDPTLTKQTVANLLKRFGVNILAADVKAKNSAVVMVTATVPSFIRNGAKLDVTVSSLADAKTLQGGTLLQTPLMGADGKVYAVAQGPIFLGGFFAGTGGVGGASLQKNHPTAGRIPGGALVEREIQTDLFVSGALEISLREMDFTSAVRLANAINEQFEKQFGNLAYALNSGTVRVFVPKAAQSEAKRMEFVAWIENIQFRPDVPARVIINEKTGTIVANARVRIDSVAVAHGNLTVSIVSNPVISQPNPFTGNVIGNNTAGGGGVGGAGGAGGTSAAGAAGAAASALQIGGSIYYSNAQGDLKLLPAGTQPPAGYSVVMVPGTGQAGVSSPGAAGAGGGAGGNVNINNGTRTVVEQQTSTQVEEEKKNVVVFNDLPTVQDVATAFNALGVTPRDMMTIFQAMKSAGALQAELILQ